MKDAKRIREKIFGRTKTDGSFQERYLQKVKRRGQYLDENGLHVMEQVGWDLPQEKPRIVSIFVSQLGFWWTRLPPIKTNVEFVQIKMLEDFISGL